MFKKKKLTGQEAIQIFKQVISILLFIHEMNIGNLNINPDILDLVIEFVKGYNQALEDMRKGIKEICDSDYIDILVKQLTK
mgnify:CR=1 FL=1